MIRLHLCHDFCQGHGAVKVQDEFLVRLDFRRQVLPFLDLILVLLPPVFRGFTCQMWQYQEKEVFSESDSRSYEVMLRLHMFHDFFRAHVAVELHDLFQVRLPVLLPSLCLVRQFPCLEHPIIELLLPIFRGAAS